MFETININKIRLWTIYNNIIYDICNRTQNRTHVHACLQLIGFMNNLKVVK